MNTNYLSVKTPRYAHNNLCFSPFFEDRIAVASGSNFGLVGNGRVHIIVIDPSQPGGNGLRVVRWFDTQDCVYDVAWNESHENQVVAACGNGALKLFDTTLEGLPVGSWHEHSAEVSSVDWNNLDKSKLVSGSWDKTVKVWSIDRTTSLFTIQAHTSQINTTIWNPHSPFIISSCSADGYINIFDIRSPNPTSQQPKSQPKLQPIISIPSNGNQEILSIDWNKYDSSIIASANKDGSVNLIDLRNPKGTGIGGGIEIGRHALAVKKVQWSPHSRDQLASSSYDMTCRVWSTKPNQQQQPLCHSQHTEFVMGLAWALFDPGLLASASWDEQVHMYRV